jgi:hypothetical protein
MSRTAAALFVLLLFPLCPVTAQPPAYRVEDVPLPPGMSPEVSAVAFSSSGRLYVANRHGDVWVQTPRTGAWHRFAHGLHEALGIAVVSDAEVYVAHKPELTRLRDLDGDGTADDYETVTDGWATTDNWHEHVFGLRRDAEGHFVLALGLADTAGPINVLWPRVPLDFSRTAQEKKLSLGPYQGWVIKVAPDGAMTPWASGFASRAASASVRGARSLLPISRETTSAPVR